MDEIAVETVINKTNLYRYMTRLIGARHVEKIDGTNEQNEPIPLFRSDRGCYLSMADQDLRQFRYVETVEHDPAFYVPCPVCGAKVEIADPRESQDTKCPKCESQIEFTPEK
jgi:DNA-directed RNA polymerase subunit RPC12/RpoP